jgi:protein tyrosine phosphatase (PTP) superfamily phosphohydrolase (DUF442 family)
MKHVFIWITTGLFSLSHGAENPVPRVVALPGTEVAYEIRNDLFAGAQPQGDEAFEALAALGVKTIVSVDGARPDTEAAARHGMAYIHLPFGYDGIPRQRMIELAGLPEHARGPFYIHCHHGKHRGPAAAAIVCLATGLWDKDQAVAWLHQARTSPDYAGLYEAVNQWTPPTAEEKSRPPVYPETTRVPDLVERMVAIDTLWDKLKTAPPAASEASAGNAVLLREEFRESLRLVEEPARPPGYQAGMREAEAAAEALHDWLKQPGSAREWEARVQRVATSCKDCHRAYRN